MTARENEVPRLTGDRKLAGSRAGALVALIGALLLPAPPSIAQETTAREVTIRGFQFDPADLEVARGEELAALGIETALQAPAPSDNDDTHWRVLQFSRSLDRDTRRQLRGLGLGLEITLGGAYLEQVSLTTVETLRTAGLLRASTPYHPAFKLAPSLRSGRLLDERSFQTERRRDIEGLLLRAVVFPDAELESAADAVREVGALDVFVQDNGTTGSPGRIVFRLNGTDDAVRQTLIAVARLDAVRSIEEIGEIILDNVKTASSNQSGNSANPTIWNRGLTGSEQAISIFDSGRADTDHCFFDDPSVAQNTPGAMHRKLLEVRDQSQIYEDGLAHATFVAASAAGDDWNTPGVHAQRGGAWSAKLVLVNLYDFYELSYYPDPPPSTLATELAEAGELANVHTNSWHDSNNEGYSDYAMDFDQFTRLNEDQLVIAAAGKDFLDWGPPAIAKNVVAVSAATPDGLQIGDGYDENPPAGRQKPDLAVVGCGIASARSETVCGTVTAQNCATSNAAPHAAAMAALARQYYVGGWYRGEALEPTGSLLKATLINSARDVTGEPGFPSVREGWGLVTLDRALAFSDSDRVLWAFDVRNTESQSLDSGEFREYTIQVDNSQQPLKVTLAWTDPPGESGDGSLKNDLDLEVTAPGGVSIYRGNNFDATAGESVAGGVADTENNVEQVLVVVPAIGEWKLRVKATEITVVEAAVQGQGYALLATAGRMMEGYKQIPSPPVNLRVE